MILLRAGLLALALAAPAAAEGLFPLVKGGPYSLTDQHGQTRTQADPDGHAQLLFFGYANCPGICSAAMPLMADVVDAVGAAGHSLRPVMITVDPARDTVETMAPAMTTFHRDFIGLTGPQTALDSAYAAFNVDHQWVYDDPEYGPVYSHGSLIYLMDAQGTVLTVLPPVLDAARATQITLKYLGAQG
ncbi:SCO family protein [Sulfitobacter albidus]|nr:SCO family protein [Sulfitobacter albidus]